MADPVNFIQWPQQLLVPSSTIVAQVPFSRSGGRSLGGIERVTRTDRGFWRITLTDVQVYNSARRRTWNAIRSYLGGRAGLIAVPAWSFETAPYASGSKEAPILTTHDDGTTFADGSQYYQGAIDIQMASFAAIGATIVTLKVIKAATVSGIRFSYQHGLYETGRVLSQPSEDTYQVEIFPSIRQAIPAGASLEADRPTCLCHLADDRGMDLPLSSPAIDSASVEFVEAAEVWTDLALAS